MELTSCSAESLANGSVTGLSSRIIRYARKHPYLFALQILGAATLIAALIAIPVLGVAGFSTVGPVAGSTAMAWQASGESSKQEVSSRSFKVPKWEVLPWAQSE